MHWLCGCATVPGRHLVCVPPAGGPCKARRGVAGRRRPQQGHEAAWRAQPQPLIPTIDTLKHHYKRLQAIRDDHGESGAGRGRGLR